MTAEVVPALRDAGIRCILLKGPATAARLYDDPLERPYEDADLLIEPSRFEDARNVLKRLGFAPVAVEVSPHQPAHHDETWRREATVELHHTLSGIAVSPMRAWAELSRTTDRLQVGEVEVEFLPPAGQALMVVLHAAHHGVAAAGAARDDLVRAVERLPLETWEEAAALARRVDADAAFGAGLRLIEEGRELAARIGAGEDRSVEAELRAASAPHMAEMLHWLRHGDAGARQKAALVLRKAVPPVEWMRATWPEKTATRTGLALAYVRRPLALLGRVPGVGPRPLANPAHDFAGAPLSSSDER